MPDSEEATIKTGGLSCDETVRAIVSLETAIAVLIWPRSSETEDDTDADRGTEPVPTLVEGWDKTGLEFCPILVKALAICCLPCRVATDSGTTSSSSTIS